MCPRCPRLGKVKSEIFISPSFAVATRPIRNPELTQLPALGCRRGLKAVSAPRVHDRRRASLSRGNCSRINAVDAAQKSWHVIAREPDAVIRALAGRSRWTCPRRRTIFFPQKDRGLRHISSVCRVVLGLQHTPIVVYGPISVGFQFAQESADRRARNRWTEKIPLDLITSERDERF
jgi:hypothetical protein